MGESNVKAPHPEYLSLVERERVEAVRRAVAALNTAMLEAARHGFRTELRAEQTAWKKNVKTTSVTAALVRQELFL